MMEEVGKFLEVVGIMGRPWEMVVVRFGRWCPSITGSAHQPDD
jgi:hypothetical protein